MIKHNLSNNNLQNRRLKYTCLTLLFLVSSIFSQEEIIKFQTPTGSSGTPTPVAPAPATPPTVPTPAPASMALPLNLTQLTAKDTASFETYSRRITLVQDSISAVYRTIEAVKKNALSSMPKLEPKNEFEKQAEYEARQAKWNQELFDKTERDTKPITMRLQELEKAKKKIEENQVSLYGSIKLTSNPDAAAIWIGREEIGATPAEYNLLTPGTVKIRVQKEGYNPWDTTFQVLPGAKYKFNAILDEKSIFSPEKEIDFVKVLSKDTTVGGYNSRIAIIEARKLQVGEEIKKILEDFSNSYPTLEPKKPDETPDAFKRRYEAWSKEGMRHVTEFQKKYETYKQKLERTIAVLHDYIIASQSVVMSKPAPEAKLELGTYDAEKETFELVVQDTASAKYPFSFRGNVAVPRNMAKDLNRSKPGFAASLQFINFPFEVSFITDSVSVTESVNLAMSKLLISNNGQDLKVEGSYGEIERYKLMDGYNAWKLRADSLLNGSLKPKDLDYAYAMGRAKAAAKDVQNEDHKNDNSGLGWRGWTRILTFAVAISMGGTAGYKHYEADKWLKDIEKLKNNVPPGAAHNQNDNWKKAYNADKDLVETKELHRNIYGIAAGVCALVGTMTFFF
jgi:hypothetical protein